MTSKTPALGPRERVRKSFKKREKLAILQRWLGAIPDPWRCLDLGCSRGVLTSVLQSWGGTWVGVDLDAANLSAARRFLGPRVARVDPTCLPFPDAAFDLVVCIDLLEHVKNDAGVLDEMVRVLRPGGHLVVGTPARGRPYVLNRIKPRIGLPLEAYGHVREGYAPEALHRELARRGIEVLETAEYARFFTELIEMCLNAYSIRKARRSARGPRRDGWIGLPAEEDFAGMSRLFRIYLRVYPLLWGISRLDRLLRPWHGYAFVLRARKPSNPSRSSRP